MDHKQYLPSIHNGQEVTAQGMTPCAAHFAETWLRLLGERGKLFFAPRKRDMGLVNWLSNGFFKSPPSAETISECDSIYTKLIGPICKAFRFVIIGHEVSVSSVAGLFRHGSPSEIAGNIAEVIINTIKGVPILSAMLKRHYIVKECLKVMPPPIMHRDAASSISRIMLTVGICASGDDAAPRDEYRMLLQSMLPGANGYLLKSIASTRHRCAFDQLATRHKVSVAAFTTTMPNKISIARVPDRSERSQSPKALTCYVSGIFMKSNVLGFGRLWGKITHVISSLLASGRTGGTREVLPGVCIGFYQSILAQTSQ